VSLLVFSSPLLADEYDDSQSHPLRVAGYLVHPVGVLLEWTLARPFHAIVSAPGISYLVGHRSHPPLFAGEPTPRDYGSAGYRARRDAAALRAPSGEPVAERVSIREVIVEKTVLKEVPKIVEVERVVFPDIAFRFDSAELTDLGRGRAYLTAQKLKEQPEIVVVIEGHADYVGREDYNQKLSAQRAERVKKELTDLGIDPARMSVASLGESKPLISQETDWARAVNRRVEFRVTIP
jgi:outer membrane protein OmpA-like peptidoglycan-associated protein